MIRDEQRVELKYHSLPKPGHWRIITGPSPFGTRNSELGIRTKRLRSSGFTLLEILVAVLILGLVVTTVLSSFNMVFSNAETLEATASVFDMGRTCLTRITLDLENAFILERPLYQTPQVDSLPDPYRFQGSVENRGGTAFAKLRFTSRAHVALDKSREDGIAEIVYYVQAAPGGGLRLKRADNLYPVSALRGAQRRPRAL